MGTKTHQCFEHLDAGRFWFAFQECPMLLTTRCESGFLLSSPLNAPNSSHCWLIEGYSKLIAQTNINVSDADIWTTPEPEIAVNSRCAVMIRVIGKSIDDRLNPASAVEMTLVSI